ALSHQRRRERNAVPPTLLFGLRFGFPGDPDARVTVGLGRAPERIEHVVHVALEVLQRAEAGRIDRGETVTDVLDAALLPIAAVEQVAIHRAAHHARQDVDHHAEAIALVTPEITRAAERCDQAVLQPDERIGGRRAAVVERPARRYRLVPPPR